MNLTDIRRAAVGTSEITGARPSRFSGAARALTRVSAVRGNDARRRRNGSHGRVGTKAITRAAVCLHEPGVAPISTDGSSFDHRTARALADSAARRRLAAPRDAALTVGTDAPGDFGQTDCTSSLSRVSFDDAARAFIDATTRRSRHAGRARRGPDAVVGAVTISRAPRMFDEPRRAGCVPFENRAARALTQIAAVRDRSAHRNAARAVVGGEGASRRFPHGIGVARRSRPIARAARALSRPPAGCDGGAVGAGADN